MAVSLRRRFLECLQHLQDHLRGKGAGTVHVFCFNDTAHITSPPSPPTGLDLSGLSTVFELYQRRKTFLDNMYERAALVFASTSMRKVRHNIERAAPQNRSLEEVNRVLRQQHLLILVRGEGNSGKSSLCNAMLGERIFPEDELPCTARLVMLYYSPTKRMTLHKVGAPAHAPYVGLVVWVGCPHNPPHPPRPLHL